MDGVSSWVFIRDRGLPAADHGPARSRPRATPLEATTVSGARTVRVQRGDTLYGIVSRLYPEANRPERWRLVEIIEKAK